MIAIAMHLSPLGEAGEPPAHHRRALPLTTIVLQCVYPHWEMYAKRIGKFPSPFFCIQSFIAILTNEKKCISFLRYMEKFEMATLLFFASFSKSAKPTKAKQTKKEKLLRKSQN